MIPNARAHFPEFSGTCKGFESDGVYILDLMNCQPVQKLWLVGWNYCKTGNDGVFKPYKIRDVGLGEDGIVKNLIWYSMI